MKGREMDPEDDDRPMDPIEDRWLDAALEDRLSQTDYHEMLAGDIYAGTDNSDPGFYSDAGDEDWGDNLSDDDAFQDWGGEA